MTLFRGKGLDERDEDRAVGRLGIAQSQSAEIAIDVSTANALDRQELVVALDIAGRKCGNSGRSVFAADYPGVVAV